MENRPTSLPKYRITEPHMTPSIEVKQLVKKYSFYKKEPGLIGSIKSLFRREKLYVEAVKGINFSIQPGEFVGFVGPNGAGKTTTLKMLSGILYPTGGDVQVLGYKPFERKAEFQKQFALVMGQKNQLWWDLPAMESFLLNKAIYEIPDELFNKNLKELSELLDIKDILDVQVRKLSLGQRMKCELVAALLHSPKVLFLDEPTIGLDVVSQNAIREFLKTYNKEQGATIILTSHYMQDIRRLCDRVIIIDHGALLYDGTYDALHMQYSESKILEFTLAQKVDVKEVEAFGKVLDIKDRTYSIRIPREKTAEITGKILETFNVDDIVIHERDIEEIIGEIFTDRRVKRV